MVSTRVTRAGQWSETPRPVVLGRSPEGIKDIQSGQAHRCKVAECDALNPRETGHCHECHRSFASDRLADGHILRGTSMEALVHADPPTGRLLYNRYGTLVWTDA